jgi:hypothetical protein
MYCIFIYFNNYSIQIIKRALGFDAYDTLGERFSITAQLSKAHQNLAASLEK